jgi:Ni,Fe-hydrogenase III large subunit
MTTTFDNDDEFDRLVRPIEEAFESASLISQWSEAITSAEAVWFEDDDE